MKKNNTLRLVVSFLLSLFALNAVASSIINGAGATFPYPLYSKWAQAYQQLTGVKLNYQPIGSGGGIKQIQAGTVDFGASDKPLPPNELQANKLVQFPAVIGGIVPIINLASAQNQPIKLSGALLAEIYLGEIKNWNNSKIEALNPGITLPNQLITVVHRSDGSGTTFLFTDYLSQINHSWKEKVGADTAVSWPVGVGGKGNEGVASYVQRIKGSIGYVEYAYARQTNFKVANLVNHAGHTVSPSLETFQAAATNANWSVKNYFGSSLNNQPGVNSWPIVGATFILLRKTQADPQKAQTILRYFDWAYQASGQEMAKQLDYVPLPAQLVTLIHDVWRTEIKTKDGQLIWSKADSSSI